MLGTVYFIQCGDRGPVKIGWTIDVPRRLARLQTGNPLELNLLGSRPGSTQDEAELHAKYSGQHIRGEWFRWSVELNVEARSGSIEQLTVQEACWLLSVYERGTWGLRTLVRKGDLELVPGTDLISTASIRRFQDRLAQPSAKPP